MAALEHRFPPQTPAPADPIPSSSPAFATPLHPIRLNPTNNTTAFYPPTTKTTTILPILLPPPTLRPIAFRTFTKKHNLTLTSSALQALATFIGKNCGSAWREEGLAELVLEEVAKMWKKSSTDVIVEGASEQLKMILKTLEACMVGGRIVQGKSTLSRQTSFAFDGSGPQTNGDGRPKLESQDSFGLSSLEVDDEGEDDDNLKDLRSWLKVVGAFEQPRLVYNADRKHFEKSSSVPSFFPPPSRKTELFRQRYHLIYQRLLRNESFQVPSSVRQNFASNQTFKITSISNLLGRTGTGHLLLGLLTVSPAGTLAINDLSGSIALDLEQATPIDQQESWLVPGMIVLVDGVYEEEYGSGAGLGNLGGIGGTISGRFVGFQVGAPKCEPRAITLGNSEGDVNTASGFGWVDFLGLGNDRAVGSRMRKMEKRLLAKHQESGKIVMIGEVNLDNSRTLEALRKIFATYATDSVTDIPMTFILVGNFVQFAAMAGGGSGGSIEYKEYFDALAALLSDFPSLLRSSTFIFVPGDNDPWPSAFSAGAATPLPRKEVPEMFTSRIRRAFASANAEIRNPRRTPGEAIWTSNPSRLSLFGPAHELVVFRDDISGRLRRNAIRLKSSATEASSEGIRTETTEMSGALPALAPNDAVSSDTVPNENETTAMEIEPSPIETDVAPRTASANPLSTPLAAARRLTKTLLDQSHLSPFPLSTRPIHWDYAHTLSLYPLPATLVLCDAEALPFVCTYQGCHVINVGACVGEVAEGKKGGRAVWVEYAVGIRRGVVKECWI